MSIESDLYMRLDELKAELEPLEAKKQVSFTKFLQTVF